MGLSSSKYSCTSANEVVLATDVSLVHTHKIFNSSTPKSSLEITKLFFSSKSKVIPYLEEPLSAGSLQAVAIDTIENNGVACQSLDLLKKPYDDALNEDEEDVVKVDEVDAVDAVDAVDDTGREKNNIPFEPYMFSSYFSFENGDVLFLKISHDKHSTNVPVSTFVGWECYVQKKGIGITRAAKWLSRHLHLFVHFTDGRKEFIKVKNDDSKDYTIQDLLHGKYLPMNVTFLQRIFKA